MTHRVEWLLPRRPPSISDKSCSIRLLGPRKLIVVIYFAAAELEGTGPTGGERDLLFVGWLTINLVKASPASSLSLPLRLYRGPALGGSTPV